jgi:hypothetical protein
MVNRKWVRTGLIALYLIGLGMAHLALTDIYHGTEPDLSAEWTVVQVSLLAGTFSFLAVALRHRGRPPGR